MPLAGAETYQRLLDANAWYRDLLPNHRATGRPSTPAGSRRIERPLRARPIDRLERWEMRPQDRAPRRRWAMARRRFGPTVCKGHFDGHRARALAAYEERLATVLAAAEEAAA